MHPTKNQLELYCNLFKTYPLKYKSKKYDLSFLWSQTLHQKDPILKYHFQKLYQHELNRRLKYVINQPFYR